MNTVTPSNSSPFFSEPSNTPQRPQRKRNLTKPQSPPKKRQKETRQKLFETIERNKPPLKIDLDLSKIIRQVTAIRIENKDMKIEKNAPSIKRNKLRPGKISKERSFSWDSPGRQSTFPVKESPLPLQLKR